MSGMIRLLLLLLCVSTAGAQEPLRLTHLREVAKLAPAKAEEQRVPVEARAIVTGPSRFSAIALVQQDDQPLRLRFASRGQLPPPNCEIEFRGVTRGLADAGSAAPETQIEVTDFKVLRMNVTPQPLRVALEDVHALRHPGRWLEFEGTVLQMRRFQGDLHVHLAGDTGWMIFFLRDMPGAGLPVWTGARLRVHASGSSAVDQQNTSAGTYGAMNVEILTAPLAAAFSAPAATAAELIRVGGTGARALVQATVLQPASREGLVWLRDGAGTAFTASSLYGFAKSSDEPRTEVQPIPLLHAGDAVEVQGSPAVESGRLTLRYSEMRVTGAGQPVPPRTASLSAAAAGVHRHDLISLSGRPVFQGTVKPQQGQQFEVVRLASGGSEIEAFFENTAAESFPRFGPDDLLQATGIAVAPGSGSADRLMLRTAQDIRSLGIAPEVLQARQWRNIALFGGGTVLATGIILMLRHRLIKERSLAGEVRVLNSSLEQRVTERTAELERAREELKAALREEREVGELKSRFVSTVSHEFRTPLGVIMSATDILESYMDRLSEEKKREHLTEIRSATRHMSGMMEDVLLLGRAESGRLSLTRRPLDLLELCQRIANETHSAASQTGVTTITSDPLPGPAMVDEMLLRHMLHNLLSNAIKYSPPGAEVKLHIAREGKDALLTVTDSGIGIPPEDHAKLFQPFARAGNVGHHSGTGLGLVVVKRCAELHSGTVTFTSTPGEGTVFSLRLPVFR